MTTRNVVVIIGSLRKESFNRKLANAVIAIAPATLRMTIVPIGGCYARMRETTTQHRDFRRVVKAKGTAYGVPCTGRIACGLAASMRF